MNERDEFWKGDFGNEYNRRSPGDVEANYHLFKRIFAERQIGSVVELGAGTGANLRALHRVKPEAVLHAVEINDEAAHALFNMAPVQHVFNESLLDWQPPRAYDLAFTKGVLIHIHPEELEHAYQRLVSASSRYVLVAEYYNPKPVEVPYRGHAGRLWKRDFAGELIERHGLRLIDYGFVYHRDPHPQDDLNWFLLEKQALLQPNVGQGQQGME
jgi:pseudaminic acid biosynthesis-associated methylase